MADDWRRSRTYRISPHRVASGSATRSRRAETLKYRAVSPKGASITAWIDPALKFLLRFRSQDGSGIDIKTIELGPQDKRLFEIPADYEKFDPKELIERVKQSDVWIEPPKAAPRTDE